MKAHLTRKNLDVIGEAHAIAAIVILSEKIVKKP